MSIRSTVNNFVNKVDAKIDDAFTVARTRVENIIGSATTGVKNLWSGGFFGMSESGLADLKTALSNYITAVKDVIAGFDAKGDFGVALKGTNLDPAVTEFIAAVKELLQAYVAALEVELAEIDTAYTNFQSSEQSVASDVQSAADDVRGSASEIKLD